MSFFTRNKRGHKSSSSTSSADDTPAKKKPASSKTPDSPDIPTISENLLIEASEMENPVLNPAFVMKKLEAIERKQEEIKNVLTTEMSQLRRDMVADMDRRFQKLSTSVTSHVNRLDGQVKALEREIAAFSLVKDKVEELETKANAGYLGAEGRADNDEQPFNEPCDNTNITVVCLNVPETMESDLMLANRIVAELGEQVSNNVKILGSMRLKTNRPDKPGLFKIAFRNLDEKKKVLSAKSNLKKSQFFSKVFIRSSKTHMERLMEMNTRVLLDNIPNGHQYRMTSHGKLIKKDDQLQRRETDRRNQQQDRHPYTLPSPQRSPVQNRTKRPTNPPPPPPQARCHVEQPPPPPPPAGNAPGWVTQGPKNRTFQDSTDNAVSLDTIRMEDPPITHD